MPDFLETLIHPDKEESPERSLVAQAANILQVGEFQLLQLAYHDWYHADMPAAEMDRFFTTYMMHNRVPPWARHYARRIIDFADRELIDIDDPVFHRYDANYVTTVPAGVRRFTLACLVLAAVMVGGIWLGTLASIEGTSVLPPYFERGELPGGGSGAE